MSFLYHKRTKTAIKWLWGAFALIIAISMTFAFSGGLGATPQHSGNVAPTGGAPANNIPEVLQVPSEPVAEPTDFSIDGTAPAPAMGGHGG